MGSTEQEISRKLEKINRNLENVSQGLDKIADIMRKTTEAMQKHEAFVQREQAKEGETEERLVKEDCLYYEGPWDADSEHLFVKCSHFRNLGVESLCRRCKEYEPMPPKYMKEKRHADQT